MTSSDDRELQLAGGPQNEHDMFGEMSEAPVSTDPLDLATDEDEDGDVTVPEDEGDFR